MFVEYPETTAVAQTIPEGVTCIDCRYDLRFLDVHGRCPECGAPIEISVVAWQRRKPRRPWTWSGVAYVVVLTPLTLVMSCATLVEGFTPWSCRRYRGAAGFPEAFLLTTVILVGLCVRSKPRQVERLRKVVCKLILLAVLVFLCYVLCNLWKWEDTWPRFDRMLGLG